MIDSKQEELNKRIEYLEAQNKTLLDKIQLLYKIIDSLYQTIQPHREE